MADEDIVKSARGSIARLGGSELHAVDKDEYMKELFTEKQRLMAEMNAAKRKAAEEAAKPFLEAIAELDQSYAMLLVLTGDNKDND
jgi:hypothetical protein